MRICELRRFLGDFVVFVNSKKDIELLKKHPEFTFHSSYVEKGKKKVYGYEFLFRYDNRTIKEAKKHVERILHAKTTN